MTAPIPDNEHERLAALRRYQILDSLPEQCFDDLTLIAANLLDMPVALVSLLDENRQWIKSATGTDLTQTDRNRAFCAHVVADGETLIVNDATADPRFATNPLVTDEPRIRFYAGAPLTTHDGHHLGTMCVIDWQPREISDEDVALLEALSRQVVSQLELRRALARAEAADRAKTSFLAHMSHELRTPLNSVIGYTQILLRDPDVPAEKRRLFLERVIGNGRHVRRLIDDILDVSKIEAGAMDFVTEDVAIDELFEEVKTHVAGLVTGRQTTVEFDSAREFAPVSADAHRLKQVLVNLVANAAKFTEAGQVRVRLVAHPENPQRIARIDVVDTGIGMTPEALDRVFEPFEQASPETSREYGGTGLGLSIARSLAEQMGFELHADSVPGRGSTFSVRLSRDVPPASHTTLEGPADVPSRDEVEMLGLRESST